MDWMIRSNHHIEAKISGRANQHFQKFSELVYLALFSCNIGPHQYSELIFLYSASLSRDNTPISSNVEIEQFFHDFSWCSIISAPDVTQ